MEKNDHDAAENLPRISSQSEQNEQPEFSFQPDYGGTLFDDTIFQTNHPQGIPPPHIFRRGSRQDVGRSSQPRNLGFMGDGENVVGNLSLNYGSEPDPQRNQNMESTFPFPVGNITRNFQSFNHRTTTGSSIAMSNPVQSSRPQGPQIGSSLGSIEGSGTAGFWSHDHRGMIYRTDRIPDSLWHNTLQRPQLDGSILSLGINTTDGDPSDGHAGTAMSGNTVMANAMLSNRLSGPLIDGSFLTAGHGGDSDVGFQVNDCCGSGHFLSMQGNMGARNLPRNHGRVMGVTNIGAGLNPFINLQTPQVRVPYQVAVPSSQLIGVGGVGDVRYTYPYGSFYYNPVSTSSSPSIGVQSAINNEQTRWATHSRVAQEPGNLSIDLCRSPLQGQQQQQPQPQQLLQQQRQHYLHNISGPNANIFVPQIRNPHDTVDPLCGFTASPQEEAGKFGCTDNHHLAPVWSRWRTNNTLEHCTVPPAVGTIGGIAAQSHSGLQGPTDGSSTNWILNNQSTSSSHQTRTQFFPESIANVNQREMLSLADAGGLVHPAKGLRGRAAKSKSIQSAAGGKLTVKDNLTIQPTNRPPSRAYEKKAIQVIQPSAKGSSRAPIQWTSSQHGLDSSTTSSEPSDDQNYIRWSPDDDQSSTFQTGEKCYICKRDVDYPPTGTMSRTSGTIPTAVLACEHVFHEECLLNITPREQATDPPCIPCAMGER